MKRKISKNLLAFIILVGGLLAAHLVFAQDLGINAVNNGLAGSLSTTDPRTIAGQIINIVLGFLGVIAVGLISYAGFLWMTANGEEEKVETAKKILKNGVIGLVIILSSWAIATFIINQLMSATGNNPGGGCYEGEVTSCGCGGSMVCSAGSYGSCVGSSCSGGGTNPTSCDSSSNPGCQAVDQICASDDYCDNNDCGCKPKGGLGDSCDLDSSNSTCEPGNNRCGAYLTCNPTTCTCYGQPVITAISPTGGFCQEDVNKSCAKDSDCATTCNLNAPNGAANNFLTISGKNFGTYAATSSKVVFEGGGVEAKQPAALNPTCVNTWQDNQIVIAVPNGTTVGAIKVINQDNLSDNTGDDYGPKIPDFQSNNISRPGLCYLDPNIGILSSEVGYKGINLYSGSAYFGDYQNNVRGLNSKFVDAAGLIGTSTTPNIQSGNSGSFVQTTVNGNLEKSNYLLFTKKPEPGEGPFISSFAPTSGNSGQYVTIRGFGFGGAHGASHVYFGTIEAAYDFPDMCLNSVWKNDRVIVKVPAGLADGQQTISITIGTVTIDTQKLNPNTFQSDKNLDLKPSLCKIEPEQGPVATPISLWGEYFGKINNEGLAKFNYDKSATGTITADGRAHKITTAVPIGAITGPVKVINNSLPGNELNFTVGECAKDADCGTQVCCPQNTYKKGRCVGILADCFIDIPTSVFEWNFSTGFSTSTSCTGLAKYFGSCQAGATCPNVPGSCSPYAGGGKKTVADCDYSCLAVSGCNNLSPNNCVYNASINKCVKNGERANCDLNKVLNYTLGGNALSAPQTCNKDGHWEAGISTTCPSGWTKAPGNKCVENSPGGDCNICSADFSCADIAGAGHCVSAPICPTGSTCEDNPVISANDHCVIPDQPTCDCCCQIGSAARDCCAPLTCEGTCGVDTGKTSGATLGKCGGCKSAGVTPETRDAACNCSGHSDQFCDINNSQFSAGVCVDCSSLSATECSNHSSACCLDSNKTADTADDICRGGNGRLVSSVVSNPNYGYCAYYDCSITNPTQCASTTPVKIGAYANPETCAVDCLKSDPCSGVTDLTSCQEHSRCCFDAKKIAASPNICHLGDKITGGSDDGYCAYYDCLTSDSTKCASTTPVKTGAFSDINKCNRDCANPPSLSCAVATSTCDHSRCTVEGFACLSPAGLLGSGLTDCGTCCCQPGGATDYCAAINPKLKCLADKGSCSGASRGLCCGCVSDTECGSASTIGCGADSCCQARPEIVSTAPVHLANNVCRNAVIKVDFNIPMDAASFSNNVLLLAERDYGSGVCPSGTFVVQGNSLEDILAAKNRGWLARLSSSFVSRLSRLFGNFSEPALADIPSAGKLYCAVPGTISSDNNSDYPYFTFAPQSLLSSASNYYLIIKGDEDLNSKTGVLSAAEVGFNGNGYFDSTTARYVPAASINFNNRSYKDSQIIKFTTLSDQGPSAGICAVDQVKLSPESYLFKTTENALNEKDDDASVSNKTFDTIADRDKVFTAQAYSSDGQSLQPTTGYFWDWNFQISDPSVAATSSVSSLPANQTFVTAISGVTDSETKITATINMNRFLAATCNSGGCSCAGTLCSNNCCNAYSGGDGFNQSSPIYVFVCNNPWPPVSAAGTWSPWVDNCQGAVSGASWIGSPCDSYNYKFYYCRDAGAAGTLDDLPAIMNQAVVRGLSGNFICSADKTPCNLTCSNGGSVCFAAGTACGPGGGGVCGKCGPDKNGDGSPDGFCIWNVLKESYFFREAILSGGEIISAASQNTGGSVKIDWLSNADQVSSYKIYYLKSGKGTMYSKEIKVTDACVASGAINNCSAVISGLSNSTPYVFKVSVISLNKTESELSAEKTATPTDGTAPAVPSGLKVTNISSSTIKFSWTANIDDAVIYRLYHGVKSGLYGESFDSTKLATSLTLAADRFPTADNYFALSAVDDSGNESTKSGEVSDYSAASSCVPKCTGKCGGESDGCDGTCSGNTGCAYSTEIKSCNAIFGVTAANGFSGNAPCKSDCSGYDTSSKYCLINTESAAWLKAPSAAQTPVGQTCLIKLNVNSGNNPLCTEADLTSTAQWFKGTVANAGNAIFCSVPGCTIAHNPNKCRYYDLTWADHCYVPKP